MKSLVTAFAFQKVPCSYDVYMPYLEFITEEMCIVPTYTEVIERDSILYRVSSNSLKCYNELIYRIPLRYIKLDDNLPTMLICHGNGEDVGHTNLLDIAVRFNVNVCDFDYAGYGMHSCKDSSEAACQKDVLMVYRYLTDNKGVAPQDIIIYGRSLGTGIACYLAHYMCVCLKITPRGLILVSPLMSAVKTITNIWVPGDIFRNYVLAPCITCPVLIVHGNQDDIVQYVCGVELAKLFPTCPSFITLHGCNHADIWTPEYYDGVSKFIQSI
jgi:pimeloyl-ACP methyl ester carboxylesterase